MLSLMLIISEQISLKPEVNLHIDLNRNFVSRLSLGLKLNLQCSG